MELWQLVKKIPKGKVTTYRLLAKKLGTSPRAVGRMLHSNPKLIEVPCHRVVRSDGSLGGYSVGAGTKIKLLKKEGVEIRGKIDLKRFLWLP